MFYCLLPTISSHTIHSSLGSFFYLILFYYLALNELPRRSGFLLLQFFFNAGDTLRQSYMRARRLVGVLLFTGCLVNHLKARLFFPVSLSLVSRS